MNLLRLIKRESSARIARERLQLLLTHERASVGSSSDLIAVLREEILAVIAKHISIDRNQLQLKIDRSGAASTLEIEVEIAVGTGNRAAA
jgi:cell division topological specificity factor